MANDFIHKARGVSDLKCHLVLTTKYRRKVLTDPMLTRLEEIFKALMEKWEGRLVEFNSWAGDPSSGEKDHVHLLLQYTPQTEPSKLINNLKTVSSRYLRKEFIAEVNKVYWKDVFWTNGYFIASCGGVTVDQLKKYIAESFRSGSPTMETTQADEQNRPVE